MMKSFVFAASCATLATCDVLPVFFRGVDTSKGFLAGSNGVNVNPQSEWLNEKNVTHYRLIPGKFPKGMGYHFDGLATVMAFTFNNGVMSVTAKPFDTPAQDHWDQCLFEGSGTSHTGVRPCLKNPVVNLLPINGQLWLTIDQRFWGRIDPKTLATMPTATPDVAWLTLNAHPACDPNTGDCFVQHPCPSDKGLPLSAQICVSKLVTGNGTNLNLGTQLLANTTASTELLLQHSHSPCVTPNFVVSKLDSFMNKDKSQSHAGEAGLLKELHQKIDNQWVVMDRRTNVATLMDSDFAFVNNHAWNCFEDEHGDVVVDVVAATDEYLDSYFFDNLTKQLPEWERMFKPAQRCIVPTGTRKQEAITGLQLPAESIKCTGLMLPATADAERDEASEKKINIKNNNNSSTSSSSSSLLFDYPTFNPLYKMRSDYKWWYAIAPSDDHANAVWFTRIIKVDAQKRTIAAEWSAPNVYVTEADFIPRNDKASVGGDGSDEDDGVLVSVLYNATSDTSVFGIFDAKTLKKVDEYPMTQVIPFHAHGISCKGARCFSNP